ncbi:hypothetical protein, partial [Acetomicrobium sp. S15 = DSM 107314]|uniref:hypothetical protein n=1 Tax=Acetomicrobium sp. S15 = DSM 107314 TaxID=2529858 RepID=UPI0018E0E870
VALLGFTKLSYLDMLLKVAIPISLITLIPTWFMVQRIQREVMRLILKRESLKTVLNAMSKPVEEYFRGREFRTLLKQQVEKMEEEHLLVGLASRLKIIDAD